MLILSLFIAAAFASQEKTCLAPAKARANLVYLHGLDDANPSKEEQAYVTELRQLATELNLGLYAERSSFRCPSKKLCWPYREPQQLAATLTAILAGSDGCFADKQIPTLLLGYSNGGYFGTRLVTTCTAQPFAAIIASGSSGDLDAKRKDFASCGKLRLVIGKNDKLTRPKTMQLYSKLKQKGGDVNLTEFAGGHRLDMPTLRGVLLELLAPTQAPVKR